MIDEMDIGLFLQSNDAQMINEGNCDNRLNVITLSQKSLSLVISLSLITLSLDNVITLGG